MARRVPRRRSTSKPKTDPYRSDFERKIAPALIASGAKYEPLTLKYPVTTPRRYKPDFVLPNGIVIEAKGYLSPSDRSKMLAVKAAHPRLDIRFLFQAPDNYTTKTKRETYQQWAIRNGFKCSRDSGLTVQMWADEPKGASAIYLEWLEDQK